MRTKSPSLVHGGGLFRLPVVASCRHETQLRRHRQADNVRLMNSDVEAEQLPLRSRIAREIAENGSMPFSRYMELALYDPADGFYSTGGRAGRRQGHFITSVESGPLFGSVIASVLDRHWHAAGRPGRFLVAEAGAGVGTLYRTVYRAEPACLQALSWTLVEQSALLRRHHDELPGQAWASTADLPAERQHLVLANELLDNLPFDIAERTARGWAQVHLVAQSDAPNGLALEAVQRESIELPVDAASVPTGARVPVMNVANAWVRRARSIADHVTVLDYAATTSELAAREQLGWLRTYRDQQRGTDPLLDPGEWDITADVAWDQLGPDTIVATQADWLGRAGIEDLVERARATWAERAHLGDLTAMIARSAIGEAEALTAPDGLGGFSVLEWVQSNPI